jgi:hypothetical protein
VLLEVVLLDHEPRPHRGHQVALVAELRRVLDPIQQRLERLGLEKDRSRMRLKASKNLATGKLGGRRLTTEEAAYVTIRRDRRERL